MNWRLPIVEFFRFPFKSLLLIFIALISFTIVSSSLAETKNTPKYVGSDACKDCHHEEYKNFTTYAKKSRSFESIERVKKGLTEEEIKECYYCHTTGYGKPGGFISPGKTPHLKNAGCEVCHGPGEFHVKTGSGRDIKRYLTLKDCEICHTSERVRAFRYKPLIHGGAH
ncbi:MAG: cytochrome c family protein [Nitrospirota bacterium]